MFTRTELFFVPLFIQKRGNGAQDLPTRKRGQRRIFGGRGPVRSGSESPIGAGRQREVYAVQIWLPFKGGRKSVGPQSGRLTGIEIEKPWVKALRYREFLPPV